MQQVRDAESPADWVEFRDAGEPAKGEFHCASCGYGVAVYRTLPPCPMCGGTSWEAAEWRPFARAREAAPNPRVPAR